VLSDVHWIPVKAVKNGRLSPTFDLHVPNEHHYIANGFVSHNTYEDVSLCLTLRQLGSRIFIDTDAIGYHHVGATAQSKKRPFPLLMNSIIFKSKWSHMFRWDEWEFL
jgi:hypothetical protein